MKYHKFKIEKEIVVTTKILTESEKKIWPRVKDGVLLITEIKFKIVYENN
jgi:hypothetical protein